MTVEPILLIERDPTHRIVVTPEKDLSIDPDPIFFVVEMAVGGFTGRFRAAMWVHEFRDFADQLERLYRSLDGKAAFTTLEGQLEIQCRGNGRGEIQVAGIAVDNAGMGNRLIFEFSIDQTFLPAIIARIRNPGGTTP